MRYWAAILLWALFCPVSAFAQFAGSSPNLLMTDTVGTLAALGALNNAASVTVNGQNGAGMLLAAGTLIGTITPEVSYDGGTTWVSTIFYDPTTQTTGASIVFASSNAVTSRSILLPGGVSNVRVRVSAYTSGTANATLRATVSPFPAGATGIQGTNAGVAPAANSVITTQNPALDPCQTVAPAYNPISITTAANTKIVTATASKKTYICSLFLFSAGADNIAIVEGTGTNCATGTAGVVGGATAANGVNLVANQGFVLGTGSNAMAATVGTNVDLCLITSAGVVVAGVAKTVQQ